MQGARGCQEEKTLLLQRAGKDLLENLEEGLEDLEVGLVKKGMAGFGVNLAKEDVADLGLGHMIGDKEACHVTGGVEGRGVYRVAGEADPGAGLLTGGMVGLSHQAGGMEDPGRVTGGMADLGTVHMTGGMADLGHMMEGVANPGAGHMTGGMADLGHMTEGTADPGASHMREDMAGAGHMTEDVADPEAEHMIRNIVGMMKVADLKVERSKTVKDQVVTAAGEDLLHQ